MSKKIIAILGISFLLLLFHSNKIHAAEIPFEQSDIYSPSCKIKNNDIAGIQIALKKLGLFKGVVNGLYDNQTSKSVISFQAKEKLPTTGVFDNNTRSKLVSLYEGEFKKDGVSPKGTVSLLINLDEKLLFVYENGKVFTVFPVAVGRNNASPIGEWKVVDKSWGPGGAYGSRWMGLSCNWAGYGIHGTNQPSSIGGAHIRGCIRMHNNHVAELFEWVKVGTSVKIIGTPYSPYYEERVQVGPGSRGSEVVLIQQKLRELGYFKEEVNGDFRDATTKSLKQFQKDHGFEANGLVTADIYAALGL